MDRPWTKEDVDKGMIEQGDPLVKKALDIIEYFKPALWFMENPNTGRLKDREYMKDLNYYIVDYCMYSDWGYRKRTRIWTNKKDWKPLICDGTGTCGNMIDGQHKEVLGNGYIMINGKKTLCNTKDMRKNMKQREDVTGINNRTCIDDRYRIPEELIFSLFLG